MYDLILKILNLYHKKGFNQKKIKFLFDFMMLLKIYCKYLNIHIYSFFKKIECIASPLLDYTTRRISGKNHKIPKRITLKKSNQLLAKWIFEETELRNEHTFNLKLLNELLDIYNEKSKVLQKRKSYHLELFENKSFMRYLKKKKKRKF